MSYTEFFGFVFFFKQKTAYEMRISDWSSDLCSSDLTAARQQQPAPVERPRQRAKRHHHPHEFPDGFAANTDTGKAGRAAGRPPAARAGSTGFRRLGIRCRGKT